MPYSAVNHSIPDLACNSKDVIVYENIIMLRREQYLFKKNYMMRLNYFLRVMDRKKFRNYICMNGSGMMKNKLQAR
jgi:hypothetical protein